MTSPSSRRSYEGQNATSKVGRAFLAWSKDRNMPIDERPPALVVALYILERATGSWKPRHPSAKDRLKLWSLRVIPSGVADYLKNEFECDTAELLRNRQLGNLLANLKKRLPLRQTAVVRSRPITKDVHLQLLEYLEQLEELGKGHRLWVLRWKAFLTTAHFAGLRISELVRMRQSWLKWDQDAEGSEVLIITIPHSKRTPEPRTIVVWATGGKDCPVTMTRLWRREAEAAGYPMGHEARFFPEVVAKAVTPRRSVAGLTLADLPELAVDVEGEDPASIPAGSTRKINWLCSQCGHRWVTRVQARAYGHGSCPSCPPLMRQVPAPTETPELVDRHEAMCADSTWLADRDDIERSEVAFSRVADRERDSFKQLCEQIGLKPRDTWERISTGGLRRGTAVELHRAGATRNEIARHLGHSRPDVSLPYLEERDLEPPRVARSLEPRREA